MSLQAAKNDADFTRLLGESLEKPVFLFKHSSTCPISAAAWREFKVFMEAHPDASCYMNLVIEDRPLARKIAADTGIPHASPQAILFRGGKASWNASHGDISRENLDLAFQSQTK
ncbi:MAG: bacillithiol system redox-active protein YtxJ [Spirochaetes bacterium]|nr:bacillithiol system redox-active protein YtxJ [Spirochaetota bacterium]